MYSHRHCDKSPSTFQYYKYPYYFLISIDWPQNAIKYDNTKKTYIQQNKCKQISPGTKSKKKCAIYVRTGFKF